MEKLVYVLWGMIAVVVLGIGGTGYGLYKWGEANGRREVRSEVQVAAESCMRVLNLGLTNWQETVGVPLTYQVQCEPLFNVAAGRKHWDDGAD